MVTKSVSFVICHNVSIGIANPKRIAKNMKYLWRAERKCRTVRCIEQQAKPFLIAIKVEALLLALTRTLNRLKWTCMKMIPTDQEMDFPTGNWHTYRSAVCGEPAVDQRFLLDLTLSLQILTSIRERCLLCAVLVDRGSTMPLEARHSPAGLKRSAIAPESDPANEKVIKHLTEAEQVIQECTHDEPPAVPDNGDDIIADVMWSTAVEQRIKEHLLEQVQGAEEAVRAPAYTWVESDDRSSFSADSWSEPVPKSSEYGDVVFIVKFNRCGKQLRTALHQGQQLETIRASAKSAGHSCMLPFGASMFLYPEQYDSILSIMSGMDLRPHHVVIADAFLPFL